MKSTPRRILGQGKSKKLNEQSNNNNRNNDRTIPALSTLRTSISTSSPATPLMATATNKLELPWKSLLDLYELMYEQDTLCAGKTPLQRRKVHYMEHTEVIEKLRNIENTNCELKLRSQDYWSQV